MTVSHTNNRDDYTGNDSTASYDYTGEIYADSDLKVVVRNTSTGIETLLALITDYTVSTGSITLVDDSQDWISASSFLDTGYTLAILKVFPLTQGTSIANQGDYKASLHESAFDKSIKIAQQQQNSIDKSIKIADSVPTADFDPEIPAAFVGAANVTLMTNAAGDGLEVGPSSADLVAATSSVVAAAEAAQLAAEVAQTAAELAETNAETAETNAAASEAAAGASETNAAASANAEIRYIINDDSTLAADRTIIYNNVADKTLTVIDGASSSSREIIRVQRGSTVNFFKVTITGTGISSDEIHSPNEARTYQWNGTAWQAIGHEEPFDIVCRYSGSDNDTITSTEDIPFITLVTDTASAWNNTGNTGSGKTDTFTAPVPGYYTVKPQVYLSTANLLTVQLFINNASTAYSFVAATSSRYYSMTHGSVWLDKGDDLRIRVNTTVTLTGSSSIHTITIRKEK